MNATIELAELAAPITAAITSEPSPPLPEAVTGKVAQMVRSHLFDLHKKIDRMFAGLLVFQWIAAVVASVSISPRTWSGPTSQVHVHVMAAILLGGALTLFPLYCIWKHPGTSLTRQVVAIAQILTSALLIHLTGGRIETHFHVFGSLAFLAFYRDWRVLVTATLVTAVDHFARGYFAPASVYGVSVVDPWRWLEHAGWVLFEDVFLITSCQWGIRELQAICDRDARLELQNASLEDTVMLRTASLSEANTRLEALATTDPLTGLPNHRALVEVVDKELERSYRFNRPCSLLFFDIDHFKALNDSCGHEAGDLALGELGQVVRRLLRGMDTLGRWGGEEFVVMLPETSTEMAMDVAEKLRSGIATNLFSASGGVHLTCSIGVATYPANASGRSELVSAADRAMYAAKRLGRNQVRLVTDPAVDTMDAGSANTREDLALQGTVEALASLVAARDDYTSEHTSAVVQLSTEIAAAMGIVGADLNLIVMVAKLHDIGKVAIPDIVLQKPGCLSEDEILQMRNHCRVGADVVSHVPSLRVAARGIRSHHERWDGEGYPDGLAGDAIPLVSRIVAVADVYCAITTERSYRQARPNSVAIAEIRRCAGAQFDPAVVDAFERALRSDAYRMPLAEAA